MLSLKIRDFVVLVSSTLVLKLFKKTLKLFKVRHSSTILKLKTYLELGNRKFQSALKLQNLLIPHFP